MCLPVALHTSSARSFQKQMGGRHAEIFGWPQRTRPHNCSSARPVAKKYGGKSLGTYKPPPRTLPPKSGRLGLPWLPYCLIALFALFVCLFVCLVASSSVCLFVCLWLVLVFKTLFLCCSDFRGLLTVGPWACICFFGRSCLFASLNFLQRA